jgi:hypothetical protein
MRHRRRAEKDVGVDQALEMMADLGKVSFDVADGWIKNDASPQPSRHE